MNQRHILPTLTIGLVGLVGCTHPDSPKPDDTKPPVTGAYSGTLVDSPVQGVAYSTTSGVKGTTDATGTFKFNAQDNVEFKLGTVSLGNIGALGLITPIELAQGNANKLQNLLVLFQSLDSDGNPTNGITIPAASAAALPSSVDLTQTPATFASSANTGLQSAMTAGGITRPIVSPANANLAFLAQGAELLSRNIWVIANSNGAAVFRFSASGPYLLGKAGPPEGAGTSGVEYGNVTLTGFDVAGYIWQATHILDTNGDWGLSPSPCPRFRIVGDQLLASGDCGGAPNVLNKMDNNPTGIVGAWAYNSATDINTTIFLFFSNGRYLMVDPRTPGDACGHPGIEFGSYSYDIATKKLSASANLFDTNGCWGLHDNGVYGTPTFTISGDGKTIAADSSDGTAHFTFYRVSK